ncbi:MAG: hypothetical protein AB7J32_19310 [Pseudonocardia sp.]
MSQLSLFSAEAAGASVTDLAGLLCGPGQIARFGTGETARLSIVLPDSERACAVRRAGREVGVELTVTSTEAGTTAVRTAFRRDLVDLAVEWTRGAMKAVPAGMQLDGAVLRMWALAVGRPDERGGHLLALDTHAPQTHLPLVAALTRLGLPPARVGRGAGLRISGVRRMQRLVELVGPPPPGLDPAAWPRCWGRFTGS